MTTPAFSTGNIFHQDLIKSQKEKYLHGFNLLEDKILSHSYERTLYSYLELSQSNYYSYTTGHPSSKNAKPWLITILNNQIIIGKARRKPTASDYTLITHWQCSFGIHATQLYPIQTMLTSPCTNCSRNSNIITNKYTILVPTKFFGRINPSDKSINLNANYLDLIYSLAIRNPIHIPPTPNITISPLYSNLV